jgi:hypothetical protein
MNPIRHNFPGYWAPAMNGHIAAVAAIAMNDRRRICSLVCSEVMLQRSTSTLRTRPLRYAKLAGPAVQAFGGRFLVRGNPVKTYDTA